MKKKWLWGAVVVGVTVATSVQLLLRSMHDILAYEGWMDERDTKLR
jgi:hypothetical protein